MLHRPALYLAVGDSMSIDLYPALDVGETDVAVALERRIDAGAISPLGAASLLERNDDARYPEFAGRDLRTRWPGIEARNLCMDGATIGDVFGDQLPEIEEREEEALVTLTVGGNDLLSAFSAQPRASLMERIVRDIAEAYDTVLTSLRERLPHALIVVTTVYDPSDRTGRIPGVFEDAGPLPLRHLDTLNTRIREAAHTRERVVLAEVYGHFLGHGATVPTDERWYWRRSLIEPSAVGASEIRRTWVEALELD